MPANNTVSHQMDIVALINALAGYAEAVLTEALMDGDPIPSKPLLQHRRDGVRETAYGLGRRLMDVSTEAARRSNVARFEADREFKARRGTER